MRPDLYKRARSRAYKAKHGLLPAKGVHSQSEFATLPDNISAEDIAALHEHGIDLSEDSFDINLEELNLSAAAPEARSPETALSYPKLLLKEIFGDTAGKAFFTETGSIESSLRRHGWDVPSFSPQTLQISPSTVLGASAESPLAVVDKFINVELAAHKPEGPSPSGSPISAKPSHELEDWLDQVIDGE